MDTCWDQQTRVQISALPLLAVWLWPNPGTSLNLYVLLSRREVILLGEQQGRGEPEALHLVKCMVRSRVIVAAAVVSSRGKTEHTWLVPHGLCIAICRLTKRVFWPRKGFYIFVLNIQDLNLAILLEVEIFGLS